jgi:hypothetical protein
MYQSEDAAQEPSVSNRGSGGLGQSPVASVNEGMIEDQEPGEHVNHGGNSKPLGRKTFRLVETSEDEDRENVVIVDKKQANRKMATGAEGSIKTSETTAGPDINKGMIDKVFST